MLWVEEFAELTPWNRFRVYWVDERCVSSENKDSNYRLAKIHLLDKVPLTSEQVFQIRGEQEDAEREVLRYSSMVLSQLPLDGRIPVFDFVLIRLLEQMGIPLPSFWAGETASYFGSLCA